MISEDIVSPRETVHYAFEKMHTRGAMKQEHERLPSGKQIIRSFDDDGRIMSEEHSYGVLEIACQLSFAAGEKLAEYYFVKKRLVGRTQYEKTRAQYPDMPKADPTMADGGAELIRLSNVERKQKAAANKRRRETPLSDEQQREAKRQIPFFQAAGGKDIDALRQFLDAGENPNAIAVGLGFTPLYSACFGGQRVPDKSLATVQLLLEYGADPNKRFEFVSVVDGRLDRGLTALMVAPTSDVARELLDAGAEVNVADEHGVTPLMRAASNGRVDVVKVLLERKADTAARNVDGCTAGDLARSKLDFFTDNTASWPKEAVERIHAYREILHLVLVDEQR